jgi:hypothetical protein
MAGSAKTTLAAVDHEFQESAREERERVGRRLYSTAFRQWSQRLPAPVRAKLNGSGSPDWQSTRTFALPVTPDNPAYRTEAEDPVIQTLEEISQLAGALPKIALWVGDRVPGSNRVFHSLLTEHRFRVAIERIFNAKNPRLEAFMVSLALNMNLEDGANGYGIAAHFGLTPQTIHEMLGDTCAALDLPKPLAKVNKARYSKTQYSHNIQRKS